MTYVLDAENRKKKLLYCICNALVSEVVPTLFISKQHIVKANELLATKTVTSITEFELVEFNMIYFKILSLLFFLVVIEPSKGKQIDGMKY